MWAPSANNHRPLSPRILAMLLQEADEPLQPVEEVGLPELDLPPGAPLDELQHVEQRLRAFLQLHAGTHLAAGRVQAVVSRLGGRRTMRQAALFDAAEHAARAHHSSL